MNEAVLNKIFTYDYDTTSDQDYPDSNELHEVKETEDENQVLQNHYHAASTKLTKGNN